MKRIYLLVIVSLISLASLFILMGASGCEDMQQSSDDVQRQQQETLLKEGTAQTGMPAIKNFRERKLLKDILELRDQKGLVTYSYMENMSPTIVHGHTALGGKLTYLGESIGFGIPYATQYTSPQKIEHYGENYGHVVVSQADPNGLFSPASADGTWVMLKNPNGKDVQPIYVEPRIVVSPFKFPMD